MQPSNEIKVISKIYPQIRDELKRISEYAKENIACNYFLFVPEEVNKEEPENFKTFQNMVDSLVDKARALVPAGYKVSLHNAFWHFDYHIISMLLDGAPSYIHLVIKPDNEEVYCVSHDGGLWRDGIMCGKFTSKGEFKSGRLSYGGLFMYDETINKIKRERELAKTSKLLQFLKSGDEDKVSLAIKQLFKSTSELSIPNILQIVKEWPIYEPIFKSSHKDIDDIETLAISISESKTRFTKEAKAKIIPYCNSTQFDVQFLAKKTMKGKWTGVDKEKLTKILVRGNFAIQLLKLEAMTEKKIPGTLNIATKLMKDKNELVRNAAVASLGALGKEKELKYLLAIGKDEEKRDKYDPSRLIKAINEIKTRLA